MPPTRTRPPQLLIASHNHGAGAELLQLAERRGYALRRAHSGAQALERAHAAPPDLVVLDESLTDMDAFAATRALRDDDHVGDRKSTRLNSSHLVISYAVFCLKKKKKV